MARWIFSFRSTGTRELTDEERSFVRRQAHKLRVRRACLGVLSLLAFLGAFACLLIATGDLRGFLVGFFALVIGGIWILVHASRAEVQALLLRRALRLGVVEEFRRVPEDDTVGRLWREREWSADSDETTVPAHWREEERFEEQLAQVTGRNPDRFLAVGLDGVPLWVEGVPIRCVMQPYVLEI